MGRRPRQERGFERGFERVRPFLRKPTRSWILGLPGLPYSDIQIFALGAQPAVPLACLRCGNVSDPRH